MTKMIKQSKLESWVDIPSVMRTKYGDFEGKLKYGIRIPIKPSTTPLIECEIGSSERIDGERARYWFVNSDQTVKVKLIAQLVTDNLINGLGYDSKYFVYTIRKK